jgi:hypothetical protein
MTLYDFNLMEKDVQYNAQWKEGVLLSNRDEAAFRVVVALFFLGFFTIPLFVNWATMHPRTCLVGQ